MAIDLSGMHFGAALLDRCLGQARAVLGEEDANAARD
jgi:hypothetical protein